MSDRRDPIIALATPPGRGAVGIVRLSGRALVPLVQALCGRQPLPRQASLHTFRGADGTPIDQGLVIHFPAPASYTGEDVLELQIERLIHIVVTGVGKSVGMVPEQCQISST